MKKSLAIILVLVISLSAVLAACQSKNEDETTQAGLENNANEFGFEDVEVTDDDGKKVTDKNGNTVTTQVAVEYVTNKKGKVIAKQIDDNGEYVTNKRGKEVTVKTTKLPETTANVPASNPTTKKQKTTASTTNTTAENEETTEKELTTIKQNKDKVPSTSDKGRPVSFSSKDQQTIKNMLEVPYLYTQSYENAKGVPIKIATHAALWMASREGLQTATFASGTIVLDLFKYFGQTVVNFKTECNNAKNKNISYVARNDTFTITNFEAPTHTVSITKIEILGNNNYYKVTGEVSGAKGVKKVIAIMQKNKLDSSLGFSVKALKWS